MDLWESRAGGSGWLGEQSPGQVTSESRVPIQAVVRLSQQITVVKFRKRFLQFVY